MRKSCTTWRRACEREASQKRPSSRISDKDRDPYRRNQPSLGYLAVRASLCKSASPFVRQWQTIRNLKQKEKVDEIASIRPPVPGNCRCTNDVAGAGKATGTRHLQGVSGDQVRIHDGFHYACG